MNVIDRASIEAQAIALVMSHFEHINAGRLMSARGQVFSPVQVPDRPLDIYVNTMAELAPFQVLSVSVARFEDVRPGMHGSRAVVWVDVVVSCALGERATSMTVWWRPDTGTVQIASRPSHWVLEKLRMSRE